MGVEVKNTYELIGTIDVSSKKFLKYGSFEIGYVYKKNAWGNGIWHGSFKNCYQIFFWWSGSRNPTSSKVMKKAGMAFEGTLRSRIADKNGVCNDLGYYFITKEEYLKLKES